MQKTTDFVFGCTEDDKSIGEKKESENHANVPILLQKNGRSHRRFFRCVRCSLKFDSREDKKRHACVQSTIKKDKKRIRCQFCGNVFGTRVELIVHTETVHEARLDQRTELRCMCSECGRCFRTRSELTHHVESKCGTIRRYKCTACGRALMTPGSLHNHMLLHTGQKSHMCDYCGKTYLTLGQLKVHERAHTQERAFVCPVCDKSFCHRQSLVTHSTLHTGVKPFECDVCARAFSCVGNLVKHRKRYADTCGAAPLTGHRVNDPNTRAKIKINTPVTSRIRYVQTEREINQRIKEYHERLVIDKKDERCEEPSLVSIPVEAIVTESCNLKDQQQFKDIEDSLDTTSNEESHQSFPVVVELKKCVVEKTEGFKCKMCGEVFETGLDRKQHQQTSHADVLTCLECKKSFSNTDSLRSHRNVFHEGRPRKAYLYVCEKCGLTFRQKALLTRHITTECGESPTSSSSTNGTPSTPYRCDECGKFFSSPHTRTLHQRVHDPHSKRFLCKFCGKNFRWKGQLKVHERSHTGEKPFKCPQCPKAFAYRESLITHDSLHTGIKPHVCEACGSRFSCVGNLIKHRATHASTCGVWYEKNKC